jgi:enterochelin esterase-like enzyme
LIIRAIIILLLGFICLPGVVQATVVDTSFYSPSLEMMRNVDIYLPSCYNPDEDVIYPIIYFLHGAGGNNNSYPELIDTLDAMIDSGRIQPVIVAKPDGYIGPYAGSMYTNSELYGDFGDYIIYDLIDFVESSYFTYNDRHYRCIMGHSMGGIGSMKIALAHPDIYGAVASLSGALDLLGGMDLWIPHILNENGGSPPYEYAPYAGVFSLLTFTAAGAFSPDIENLPYMVDFPLDSQGDVVDSVFDRWLEHNPANMVSSLPPDHDLSIYFDCGTYDHLEFYPMNTAFAETLDNHAIEYQFQVFSGDHYHAGRLPIALAYLDSVMNAFTEIAQNEVDLPARVSLYQNYPNPFNGVTQLRYVITELSYVSIDIYDVLGREVDRLFEGEQIPGEYIVNWDAARFPSGIYFARLKASGSSKSAKMLLLK